MRTGWISAVMLMVASVLVGCNDGDLTQQPQDFVDTFRQQRGDKVDVLWVVDNSGSMGDEQAKLADNFNQFINYFVDLELDFNMAIVTTDVTDPTQSGRFQGTPKVLRPDTPDLINTFKTNINVGTNGDGTERGLEAARLALSEPLLSGENAGFLREDAYLAIIFVSDEDDGGSEADAPVQDPVADYIQYFQDLKGSDLFSLSVLIGDTPNGCSNSQSDADPGYRYEEAAGMVGGLNESICNEDFAPVLARLGEFIGGLVTAFPLSYVPIDGTVTVLVDGVSVQPDPTTWQYKPNLNAVQFASEAVPSECVEVRIQYTVAGGQEIEEDLDPEGGGTGFEACPQPTPSGEFGLEGGSVECAVVEGEPARWPHAGLLVLLVAGALGLAALRRR